MENRTDLKKSTRSRPSWCRNAHLTKMRNGSAGVCIQSCFMSACIMTDAERTQTCCYEAEGRSKENLWLNNAITIFEKGTRNNHKKGKQHSDIYCAAAQPKYGEIARQQAIHSIGLQRKQTRIQRYNKTTELYNNDQCAMLSFDFEEIVCRQHISFGACSNCIHFRIGPQNYAIILYVEEHNVCLAELHKFCKKIGDVMCRQLEPIGNGWIGLLKYDQSYAFANRPTYCFFFNTFQGSCPFSHGSLICTATN